MRSASAVVAALLASACGRVSFDPRTDATSRVVLGASRTVMNQGSQVQLLPSGGVPPYTFTTTDGWLDPASGVLWSPSWAADMVVTATDAFGDASSVTISVRGSTVFFIGGQSGATTSLPEIRTSTDGRNFSVTGALPLARSNGALLVYDDLLFYIGGAGNNMPQREVFRSADGLAWTMIGLTPERVVSNAYTVFEGAMWMLGGYDGATDHAEVLRSTDGIDWQQVGTYPRPRHEHDMLVRDGELVVLGGHSTSDGLLNDIIRSRDGITWTLDATRLTFSTDFTGVGELGPRVVRTCGQGCTTVEASDDLVTWQVGSLPDGDRLAPCVMGFQGRFILVGGDRSSILESSDGLTWTTAGSLGTPINRGSMVQFTPP